ncbi:hypothetical protein SMWOGL2_48060 [Sporomusa malonica]
MNEMLSDKVCEDVVIKYFNKVVRNVNLNLLRPF